MGILNEAGITPEDLGEITNKFKKNISDEVEIRNIPYEYRFLMLNVILCTMLKTTVQFYKKFVESLREIENAEQEKTEQEN